MAATTSARAKSGKKPAVFACEICKKNGIDQKYSRIEYLNRHERTHTETKPFLCEYCGKRYARSDVLFRHRRKCNLLVPGALGKPVESRANAEQQTSLRAKTRDNVQPYPVSRTSNDSEIPNNAWDDINNQLFTLSADKRDGVATSFVPPETLPIVLDSEVALNQTSYVDSLNPDSASSLALYNYNLNAATRANIYATDSPDASSAWNEADAFTVAMQGKEDIVPAPFECNPFVTEPKMVLIENNLFRERCGLQRLEPTNSFYLDPKHIMLCYMVPTWDMPNVTRMSALACRTFNTILEHMGIVHMPTFRLSDAHGWILFAMCTTAPRPGSDLRNSPPATNIGETPIIRKALEDMDKYPGWAKAQDTIRREKSELLIKSFHQTVRGQKLTAEESLPLIHSLLLYNSSSFLSENQNERLAGELYLGTITSIARQSGLFNPGADCTKPGLAPTAHWEDMWKKWISRESWRRTAWLVYTLDSLASLETRAIAQVPTRDVRHIPLPCANFIWKAPSAEEWCRLVMLQDVAGLTLDNAMYCLGHYVDGPCQESRIFTVVLGPYARHIVILTVLRGLIEYGQGKPKGGYVTRRWVLARAAAPKPQSPDEIHNYIISGYSVMLDAWRRGWDFDMNCETSRRSAHFVHDALPPYWLCRSLIDYLTPLPPPHVPSLVPVEDSVEEEEDGPNRLADLDLKAMLTVARQFVSNGEGLCMSSHDPPPSPVPQDPFADLFGATG